MRFVVGGLLLLVVCSLAFAPRIDARAWGLRLGLLRSRWGSPERFEDVSGSSGNELRVTGHRTPFYRPTRVEGTVHYEAESEHAFFFIHRVRFEVRREDGMEWITVSEATVPDPRIRNGGAKNTFDDVYAHVDLDGKVRRRFLVWSGPDDLEPPIRFGPAK